VERKCERGLRVVAEVAGRPQIPDGDTPPGPTWRIAAAPGADTHSRDTRNARPALSRRLMQGPQELLGMR